HRATCLLPTRTLPVEPVGAGRNGGRTGPTLQVDAVRAPFRRGPPGAAPGGATAVGTTDANAPAAVRISSYTHQTQEVHHHGTPAHRPDGRVDRPRLTRGSRTRARRRGRGTERRLRRLPRGQGPVLPGAARRAVRPA